MLQYYCRSLDAQSPSVPQTLTHKLNGIIIYIPMPMTTVWKFNVDTLHGGCMSASSQRDEMDMRSLVDGTILFWCIQKAPVKMGTAMSDMELWTVC